MTFSRQPSATAPAYPPAPGAARAVGAAGAPACRYGVAQRKDLCVRHAGAWERAGMPDLQGWLDGLPGGPPAVPLAGCLISSCQLWAEPGSDWCRSHGVTWKRRGRPPAAALAPGWVADVAGSRY